MIYYEILEDGSIGQTTDDKSLAKRLGFYDENNVVNSEEDFVWYKGKKHLKSDIDYEDYLQQEKNKELRRLREPLLIAFDKYKSNVNYGVEFESEEQREKIIAWYRLLLELNEFAFENVPDRVKYYL